MTDVQFASVYPMILELLSPENHCPAIAAYREMQMRQFTWEMFSARLEQRRKEKNYSITDMERGIGMNNVYYRAWELGKKKPGIIETFSKICAFLETDPRYFLGLIDLPDISEPHFQPLKHEESNIVADIIDSIDDQFFRSRFLSIAQLEEDMVLHVQQVIREKNEKIIGLLGGLIEVESGKTPDIGTVELNKEHHTTPIDRELFNWERFGARLKARREEKDYTQDDVTKNIGISRSYYANLEVSNKTPGALTNFINVCIFLETDPRYFLCLSDDADPNAPSYISRKHPETNAVAAIVDRLPDENRARMVAAAKLERKLAEASAETVSAKNSKIITLLRDLIGAVEGEVNISTTANRLQSLIVA